MVDERSRLEAWSSDAAGRVADCRGLVLVLKEERAALDRRISEAEFELGEALWRAERVAVFVDVELAARRPPGACAADARVKPELGDNNG